MSSSIEDKCIAKGVKLTEQRKIIAKLYQNLKKFMESQIIQMLMNFIKECQT